MRIKFVMKDTEYRDALIRQISRVGPDMYIEVGMDYRHDRSTLLVTDIGDGRLKPGMVYLSPDPHRREIEGDGPYAIFRYAAVTELIADLADCFCRWTGRGTPRGSQGILAGICTVDNTHAGTRFAELLAKEVIYRKGLRALYLPLTDLQWGLDEKSGPERNLKKLIYYAQENRPILIDTFFRKDHDDVYRLRIPDGRNELTAIPSEARLQLIRYLSRYFPMIVADIGTAFSAANISVLTQCDTVFCICPKGLEERKERLFSDWHGDVIPLAEADIGGMTVVEMVGRLFRHKKKEDFHEGDHHQIRNGNGALPQGSS